MGLNGSRGSDFALVALWLQEQRIRHEKNRLEAAHKVLSSETRNPKPETLNS